MTFRFTLNTLIICVIYTAGKTGCYTNHRVSFRLMNIDYEMSLEHFCLEMDFANAGFIHDSWNHDLKPFGNVLPVLHDTTPVLIRLATSTTPSLGTFNGSWLAQFGVGKSWEQLGQMRSSCYGPCFTTAL